MWFGTGPDDPDPALASGALAAAQLRRRREGKHEQTARIRSTRERRPEEDRPAPSPRPVSRAGAGPRHDDRRLGAGGERAAALGWGRRDGDDVRIEPYARPADDGGERRRPDF